MNYANSDFIPISCVLFSRFDRVPKKELYQAQVLWLKIRQNRPTGKFQIINLVIDLKHEQRFDDNSLCSVATNGPSSSEGASSSEPNERNSCNSPDSSSNAKKSAGELTQQQLTLSITRLIGYICLPF